jgi:hypothetical protein
MSLIVPKYMNPLDLRFPDKMVNPLNSDYNYLYSAVNKTFLFKPKGESVKNVTIDFPHVDNLYIINDNLTTP